MFHDIEQNTDEWLKLRSGKLTMSNLSKVMANYPKAFGEGAKKLAVTIAIEQITGVSLSGGFSNFHMERGHEEEPIARALYEEDTFCTVTNGGFFESGFLGCSPDGLVDDDGVIEIKSGIPHAHYDRVRRGKLDPTYRWQCVGNLKQTGRDWLDFISYCADFPEDRRLYVFRIFASDLKEDYSDIELRVRQFEEYVFNTKIVIDDSEYMKI